GGSRCPTRRATATLTITSLVRATPTPSRPHKGGGGADDDRFYPKTTYSKAQGSASHGRHSNRRRHNIRSRFARGLRGQGRPGDRGGPQGASGDALAAGAAPRARRTGSDRGGADRARRRGALPADPHHRRHRTRAARRDAGGDGGGLRPDAARFRRADAAEKPRGSPDRHSVPPGRG